MLKGVTFTVKRGTSVALVYVTIRSMHTADMTQRIEREREKFGGATHQSIL